jgi:hypothetical protein
MKPLLLFLIITFSALNANAQLGNLFRKIGDTLDEVSNKLNEAKKDEENKQNKSESSNEVIIKKEELKNEKPSADVSSDIKNLLTGRWSYPRNCQVVTKRKSGYYIFLNNNQELIIQVYDNENSKLMIETKINKIETFTKNGRNFVKLLGFASDDKQKNMRDDRTWDITNISNNEISQWERNLNNQNTVKDGIALDVGKAIPTVIKCNTQDISQLAIQSPKLDDIDYLKKNSFSIKGIELGGFVPNGFICVKDKFYDVTKKAKCDGKVTILETPYLANLITLNDKVVMAILYDDIWNKEWENVNGRSSYNKDLWDRQKSFGILTVVNDFSIYMNDLVKNIIERTGSPKNIPKIVKKEVKSIDGLSASVAIGISSTQSTVKELENKKQLSSKEQDLLQESRRRLSIMSSPYNALESLCKSCKSTYYDFSWDIEDYSIKVITTVPVAKDAPFPFYSSVIVYSFKDQERNIQKLTSLEKMFDEEESNNLIDFNKKIEVKKNENRKKDF